MSFDMDKGHRKVCESVDSLSDFVIHVIIVQNGMIGKDLCQFGLFCHFHYCSTVVAVDNE